MMVKQKLKAEEYTVNLAGNASTPALVTAMLPSKKHYHLRLSALNDNLQHLNITLSTGYLKCSSMQMVKDDLLQIGFNFLHFAENNAALTFDLLLPQNAVLDDVRQYLHCSAVTFVLHSTTNNNSDNSNKWLIMNG